MSDALRRVLESEPRVAYALLFGSGGRGTLRPGSDFDVALGLVPGSPMTALELGDLASRLETAAGRRRTWEICWSSAKRSREPRRSASPARR